MSMSKLTPAIQAAICTAITAGVPLARACILAGLGESTVLEWIRRGESRSARRSSSAYVAFAEAVAKARAQDEARRVARINQAGQGGVVTYRKVTETVDADGHVVKRVIEEHKTAPDWRADAWHLERSRPQEWGRREHVDASLDVAAKVRVVRAPDKVSNATDWAARFGAPRLVEPLEAEERE